MTDLPATIIEVERPDPKLIQQLFDEDPLKLSDQDIDTIILSFRMDRQEYLQPKEAKASKAKKASEKKESSQLTLEVDADILNDLGLDL